MGRSVSVWVLLLTGLLAGAVPVSRADRTPAVDYMRDVRPILSENCYTCHGPDANQRKAGLRLDVRTVAVKRLKSGNLAIVPGDLKKSALVSRITSADPEEIMPPAKSGKKLTEAQVETLKRWIEEGARFERHWMFVPPERPAPPPAKRKGWVRNSIDRFILARLEREGLDPSPEADRITLLRRLSFDLTGLPPTPEAAEAFLADRSAGAYEAQVDRLLKSPRYGERMAIFWLDLVRFADSRGYHSDNPRNVAPYRDYVIRTFNDNLPFDRFTVEQLAGDLLPEPTLRQRVASCYNKLNQTTEEGGAQAREYEAKTSGDRVRNVSSVWMGATLGCAECHDHKFDPWTTRDFYSMAAFFADIDERPIADRDKGIAVPSPEQEEELRRIEAQIAALRKQIDTPTPELEREQIEWEKDAAEQNPPAFGPWHVIGPFRGRTPKEAFTKPFPPEQEIDLKKKYGKLRWVRRPKLVDGKVHPLKGNNSATYLYRTIETDAPGPLALSLGSDDGIKVWVNGAPVLSKEVYRGVAPDQEKITVPLEKGTNRILMKIHNGGGGYGFYFKPLNGGGIPKDVHRIVTTPREKRTAAQAAKLAAFYRSIAPRLRPVRDQSAGVLKKKEALEGSMDRCLVSKAGTPRVVRILPRGNWLNASGETVLPAIPAFLGSIETGGRRATRKDLAEWLVEPGNPLTARTFVNRLWKLFFGIGLSKRLDDLGTQGEPPVHPELLDWMAVEFVERGWDVKRMVRTLVTSAAYRQTSIASPDLLRRDPYNRLVARQSRWRLDAELVRDNALAISGLLNTKMGGRSVRPYQPAGYWFHLNFPKRKWMPDTDDNLWRRGIYTWWQRSFHHPSLMAFDAPSREECTAERPRSNIPQQALVLLNDPTYVEAARVFAHRILENGGRSPEDRLTWAWRRALSRPPRGEEKPILLELYRKHRARYAADPQATRALVGTGAAPVPANADKVELAAWTSVARAILNLHETVTRN